MLVSRRYLYKTQLTRCMHARVKEMDSVLLETMTLVGILSVYK